MNIITMKKYVNMMIEKGYVVIPFDTSFVQELITSFSSITQADEYTRNYFVKENSYLDDFGLTAYSSEKEVGKDSKQYWHHSPQGIVHLLNKKGILLASDQLHFLQCADSAYSLAYNLVDQFVKALDVQLKHRFGLVQRFIKSSNEDHHVLRVLDYHSNNANILQRNASAGAPHTDRCGITVHFASNGSLGIWNTKSREHTRYTPEPNKIVIFASDQLQLITGGKLKRGSYFDNVRGKDIRGGEIPALTHEPLHGRTKWSDKFIDRRMAVVFFAHLYHKGHVAEALRLQSHDAT